MFASPVTFNSALEVFTSFKGIDRLSLVVETSQVPIASFWINSPGHWVGFS